MKKVAERTQVCVSESTCIADAMLGPQRNVAEYLMWHNKDTVLSPSEIMALNTFEKKSEVFVAFCRTYLNLLTGRLAAGTTSGANRILFHC